MKIETKNLRPVLDACCGSRMFWFNKQDDRALFMDNRIMEPTKLSNGATIEVKPDVVVGHKTKENQMYPETPFCEFCKEKDCCVSNDGTCAMIRRYLKAVDDGVHVCAFSMAMNGTCLICGKKKPNRENKK